MLDAKARQDCIKEIDLLKVNLINHSQHTDMKLNQTLQFLEPMLLF